MPTGSATSTVAMKALASSLTRPPGSTPMEWLRARRPNIIGINELPRNSAMIPRTASQSFSPDCGCVVTK